MSDKKKNSKREKPLTREDVLKLIEEHGGPEGLDLSGRNLEGIDLSGEPTTLVPLHGINLSGANLQKANFSGAELIEANLSYADLIEANLSGSNLSRSNLSRSNLSGADLSLANLSRADLSVADLFVADLFEANLSRADLSVADFSEAKLSGADFSGADFSGADLSGADLIEADLSGANLSGANLSGANLSGADLSVADLSGANLSGADLGLARIAWTIFGDVDLSVAKGLDTVRHFGPSTIGMDTLQHSKGAIPEDFLRGCGISPWEIEVVRLYDPALTSGEISEILDVNIFRKRTDGPLYIGGIFISYSHADSKFVDKLYGELKESGAAVWLDRHDLVAGPLKEQIIRALRIQDIVILVLSKNSIDSDWVEHELEIARDKEKEEHRDVLCPIRLDDSWKTKVKGDVLWRQLKKKNVLDFSAWKTEKLSHQFEKLLDGIKIYYK